MGRSALEEGLKCSPTHWVSIDNLVKITFLLGDYLACLGYCSLVLERDPTSSHGILYKSKVYNEMPFLKEVYNDQDFVPVPTEIETFHVEMQEEAPREPLYLDLKELTVECLASSLYELNLQCDAVGSTLNPIDTENSINRMVEQRRLEDESRIQVSVQNLVDEIIDIIEEEEEVEEFIGELLDELLCKMFGVEPKTDSEKICSQLMNDILSSVVEKTEKPKKKSVVIEAKPQARKKVSPFDEIPEDLIEKRRSSRKSRIVESTVCSDASSDLVNIQTPRELLQSFLPPNLKLFKEQKVNTLSGTGARTESAAKTLFKDSKESKWFTEDEERKVVEKFLVDNTGKTIWHLMRAFLDFAFR